MNCTELKNIYVCQIHDQAEKMLVTISRFLKSKRTQVDELRLLYNYVNSQNKLINKNA